MKAIAASLAGLTSLAVQSNSISVEGAKAIAASLSNLATLDIGGNLIGDEGVNAIAVSLTGLVHLDLTGTFIENAESVQHLLERLTKLQSIRLKDTFDDVPLRWGKDGPTVPPEVAAIQDPRQLLARLKEYRPGAAMKRKRFLGVRAAIVGRRQIGKSHLWKRLHEGNVLDQPPRKTESWELRTLTIEGAGPENQPVDVRFFDLGGDLELHGGHRTLFGDRRCLYVIVVDASKARSHSLLDYWLRIVRTYGLFPTENGDGLRCAPTVVVLSWRDQGTHADFSQPQFDQCSLLGDPPLDVELVRDYWDPIGKGAASDSATRQLNGLNHETQFEAVRGALLNAIKALHPELRFEYQAEYEQVIRACEDASGFLGSGPVTRDRLREVFFEATRNELDKTDTLGLDLLRNMGIVICPDRDAELSLRLTEAAARQNRTVLAPRESPRARESLRGLVFGVTWLRAVMYGIVSGADFKHDSGVVTGQYMIRRLTELVGGNEHVAQQTLEFLILQRLVFEYKAVAAAPLRYIVVDRIKATLPDENLVRNQERIFKGAKRFTMKLNLLLATHLPQFIGQAYSTLQDVLHLDDDVRRDRVVVRDKSECEVLLTADLNAGEIHAAVIGGDARNQQKLLDKIEHELHQLTGESGAVFSDDCGPTGFRRPRVNDAEGPFPPLIENRHWYGVNDVAGILCTAVQIHVDPSAARTFAKQLGSGATRGRKVALLLPLLVAHFGVEESDLFRRERKKNRPDGTRSLNKNGEPRNQKEPDLRMNPHFIDDLANKQRRDLKPLIERIVKVIAANWKQPIARNVFCCADCGALQPVRQKVPRPVPCGICDKPFPTGAVSQPAPIPRYHCKSCGTQYAIASARLGWKSRPVADKCPNEACDARTLVEVVE